MMQPLFDIRNLTVQFHTEAAITEAVKNISLPCQPRGDRCHCRRIGLGQICYGLVCIAIASDNHRPGIPQDSYCLQTAMRRLLIC